MNESGEQSGDGLNRVTETARVQNAENFREWAERVLYQFEDEIEGDYPQTVSISVAWEGDCDAE